MKIRRGKPKIVVVTDRSDARNLPAVEHVPSPLEAHVQCDDDFTVSCDFGSDDLPYLNTKEFKEYVDTIVRRAVSAVTKERDPYSKYTSVLDSVRRVYGWGATYDNKD